MWFFVYKIWCSKDLKVKQKNLPIVMTLQTEHKNSCLLVPVTFRTLEGNCLLELKTCCIQAVTCKTQCCHFWTDTNMLIFLFIMAWLQTSLLEKEPTGIMIAFYLGRRWFPWCLCKVSIDFPRKYHDPFVCLSVTVNCTICKTEVTKIVAFYGMSWEGLLSQRVKWT